MKRLVIIASLMGIVFLLGSNRGYSQVTFQRTYGYSMMDMFSNVRQTSDNGFILSGTSMDGINLTGSIVKTLPNGDISWGKNFNGVSIDLWPFPDFNDGCSYMINNIKQTADNGYIITGQISPMLSLYVDYTDAFLIKLTSAGAVSWCTHYGGNDADAGKFVMQTSDGGYLVTGNTYSFSAKDSSNIYVFKTSNTGVITWEKTFQISSVDDDMGVTAEEVSDGYIIGGYSEQVNGDDTLADMMLIKTNKTNGTILWSKIYGLDVDDERIYDITLSTSGDLLVTGYTTESGSSNTLLMKVNTSNGNVVSSTSYYSGLLSMADEGHSIQNTSDGGIAIIGFSINLFGAYSILLKTDATGNSVSLSKAYDNGFAGMQFFTDGQQTADGGYVIGNMGPGAMAWDFGLIKTDATGTSGCNESTFTPTQDGCTFNPENVAPSSFSGTASESIIPVVSSITITESTLCCSPGPDNAGTVTGLTTVCQGQSGVTYTVPSITNATGYNWTLPTGAGIASGSNTNTITVNFSAGASSGNITVYGTNNCGDGVSSSLYITVNAIPDAAGTISGTSPVCQGQTGVIFTVPPISGATGYQWSVPSGATIVGGSGTASITVNFSASASSGNITVYGTNSCGNGTSNSYSVTVSSLPGVAGVITGTSPVCQGATGVGYSVPPISGATGYDWTLSPGAGISTGSNTSSITVNFSGSATSGTITVLGTNLCGSGTSSSFPVTVNTIPLSPGVISGDQDVCQSETGFTYSISSIGNATGYVWTAPPGATITGGANTNSITVDYPGTAASGAITVYGTNDCGNGTSSSLNITVNPLPDAAGTIDGTDPVCQGQNSVIYTVSPISNTSGYQWSVPAGATIISGSATNSITVNFSGAASSGNISVYGSNNCGNGASSTFSVTVNTLPEAAGIITGTDTVCQGESGIAYSVPPISGATGYSWTLPPGTGIASGLNTNSITVDFSGSSTSGAITVSGTNGCGSGTSASFTVTVNTVPQTPAAINGDTEVCQTETGLVYSIPLISDATGYAWTVPSGVTVTGGAGTNSITVDFTDSSATGDITVYGINDCGNSQPSVLNITVNSLPDTAGVISGTSPVCQGQNSVVFALAAIQYASTYVWSVPAGASIVGGAGTNSITINFSTTASAGDFTVYGTNYCGNGVSSSYTIAINPLPDAAGTITGADTVCRGETGIVYSVPPVLNATGYNWTLPVGASISGGSNTNSITVDFSGTAVSGTVSVSGTNACGSGISSSFPVTVNTVPQTPGAISGDNNVCQTETGLAYSIANISNADSYVWTVPAGVSITGGAGSNVITVTFSDSAASGAIAVYGTNECGNGQPSSMSITVNTLPDSIGVISGTTPVCQGQNGVVYTVPVISNATGYQWSVSAGATIVSGAGTNSITVNFSTTATSGNFQVYGTNICGNGNNSVAFPVTVNPLPSAAGSITGTTAICEGASGVSFSVSPITNATSYHWTVPTGAIISGTSTTNSIMVNFPAGAISGNITVYGINSCGNGVSSTYPVTINQNPVAQITGNTEICEKGSVTLTATGGDSYEWDNGTATAVMTDSPNINTAYSVTVTVLATGCSDSASVNVTVHQSPDAEAGIDKEICAGSSTTLNASGGITYQWTPILGLNNPATANPEASPQTTTEYFVEVSDTYGCTDIDSVTVTVNPLPLFSISKINIKCHDDNDGQAWITILSGEPPVTYAWSTGSTNDTISNLTAGLYTIMVSDGNGCQDAEVVNITEPQSLTVTLHGDSASCHNSADGSATAVVTGGATPYSYTWSDNNTTTTPTVTGLSPGIYYEIYVYDNNLCFLNDSIRIYAPQAITTGIASKTATNCYNGSDGSATVWSSGGTGTHSYLWPLTPGNIGPSASGLSAGVYTVTVSDVNNCKETIPVTILQPEKLEIYSTADSTSCVDANDGSISLIVSGGVLPYTYSWTGVTSANSTVKDLVGGTYTVTVSDFHLCKESKIVEVYSNPNICLEIPSAFTPNSDGKNDGWQIVGIEFYPEATVEIYNRWGSLLFESKGYLNQWDGKYNGKELPMGSYVYIVNLNNGDEPYVGTVTIIR